MSEDEVQRLRHVVADLTGESVLLEHEIERLRSLLIGIQRAITEEGRSPAHHQQVMRRHRKEWPSLWKAINKAMEGIG
jgi:hypothetical protein